MSSANINLVKEARKKAQEVSVILKHTGNNFIVFSSEACQGDRTNTETFVKTLSETKPTNEVGKLVFSANDTHLVGYFDIPETLRSVLDRSEWSSAFIEKFPFLHRDASHTVLSFESSIDNEIFPFKLKDELIQFGIDFLKKKGAIRSASAEESDDEQDYAQEMGIEW